jgi:hypothetical protein
MTQMILGDPDEEKPSVKQPIPTPHGYKSRIFNSGRFQQTKVVAQKVQ